MNQFEQMAILHLRAFIKLIKDVDYFEFEDRKRVQEIVLELLLHNEGDNNLVRALASRNESFLEVLLQKYSDKNCVTFIGKYLRVFVRIETLLKLWTVSEDLAPIRQLLMVAGERDFTV